MGKEKGGLVSLMLFLLVFASSVQAARVFGTVYDSNLNPITKAVVVLNTTPEQRQVALNGSYAFFVPDGSYRVNATALGGNLTAFADVVVTMDGDFRVDLIAFEAAGSGLDEFGNLLEGGNVSSGDLNETGASATPQPAISEAAAWDALAELFFGLLFIGFAAAYFWTHRKNGQPPTSNPATLPKPPRVPLKPSPPTTPTPHNPPKPIASAAGHLNYSKPLTADQQRVLDTIRKMDGRVSQKELRKALSPWSEAKVSMELTELEDGGLVRKIKKGRGNIVRLN